MKPIMKTFSRILFLFLFSAAFLNCAKEDLVSIESVEPDVEWRGIWVSKRDIDTREKADRALEIARQSNLNALIINAFAPHDMIQYVVDKSNKEDLGIEFHIWVENYRIPPPKKKWQFTDPKGGGRNYSDLARPEIQEIQIDSMLSPFRNYKGIIGTHFDYIRYDVGFKWQGKWWDVSNKYCYCDYCRDTFKKEYGYDPIVFAKTPTSGIPPEVEGYTVSEFVKEHQHEWNQWRKDNITRLVRKTYEVVKAQYPDRVISAATGSSTRQLNQRLQETYKWINEGWITFCNPMMYSTSLEAWRKNIQEYKDNVERFDAVFPGMAFFSEDNFDVEHIIKKIHIARQMGARGFTIFVLGGFMRHPEIITALREGPCKKKVKAYHPWEN